MPKKPSNFDQTAYITGFKKANYDRISLELPKGYKEELKARAAANGVSMNAFIRMLIDREITVKDLHINTDENE